jgi:hypothetical protein
MDSKGKGVGITCGYNNFLYRISMGFSFQIMIKVFSVITLLIIRLGEIWLFMPPRLNDDFYSLRAQNVERRVIMKPIFIGFLFITVVEHVRKMNKLRYSKRKMRGRISKSTISSVNCLRAIWVVWITVHDHPSVQSFVQVIFRLGVNVI